MKVLLLCLSLVDVSASLEILDNISVTINMKKYDTSSSRSFLSRTSLWYSINLITK